MTSLILLIVTIVGLRYLFRYIKQNEEQEKRRQEKDKEKNLLRLIERKGGRVTLLEVVASTDLSIEQAREHLDAMCRQHIGEKHVTPSGTVVYFFADFISEAEKKSAQAPQDFQ